ncbi:substrate-binding domain-containing protein [Oerskovia sp. M15]
MVAPDRAVDGLRAGAGQGGPGGVGRPGGQRGFDVAGGRSSTAELLRRRPDITAIFAASDEMAMGAILAARDLGLDVPGDLSVIGVDGHDLGELVGLTTIGQDAFQQGADASMLLMEMINGAPVPESLTYPTHLVRRSSTAPPR